MSKGSFSVDMEGVSVSVTAPYCTAEQWAERTGMKVGDVKSRLNKGLIARFQVVKGGTVYVNVLHEVSKTLNANPY